MRRKKNKQGGLDFGDFNSSTSKIKPKEYPILVSGILSPGAGYYPRKKPDQLCIIVDTKSEKIYPVPTAIEHVDFAAKILGYAIQENPEEASNLVPSNIRLKVSGFNHLNDFVEEIVTGTSGMEVGFGLRHSPEQLKKAHEIAKSFVEKGGLPHANNYKERIIMKYAQNASSQH